MASVFGSVTSAVSNALAHLPEPSDSNMHERIQLLTALDQLRLAIEPPTMTLGNLVVQSTSTSVVETSINMGVFDAFAAVGKDKATVDELLPHTKGDNILLQRMLRLLNALGVVQEVGLHTYRPRPIAKMLVKGTPPVAAFKHHHSIITAVDKLDKYLASRDYRTPVDVTDGLFQYAYSTDKTFFDWLKEDPAEEAAFNTVMTMGRLYRGDEWYDFFPVKEKLRVTSPDQVVFIDLGGGIGHDIADFKARHSDLPGRMILQDLPNVIAAAPAQPAGIEVQPHDMFNPQPVKGAKAYYMRTVLHDWPDKQALLALVNLREAMGPDSLLLIDENTLPEQNCAALPAYTDLAMMTAFASLERTEEQWLTLIDAAGFHVVNIWKPAKFGPLPSALYEAVPK